jgi:hypothetical protein
MEKAKTNARSLLRRIAKTAKSSDSQKSPLPSTEASYLSPTQQPHSESTDQPKVPEDDDASTRMDLGHNAITPTQNCSLKSIESPTPSQKDLAEVSPSDPSSHAGIFM